MKTIEFIVVHTGQADTATILNAAQVNKNEPTCHYHISTKGITSELRSTRKNSALGERAGAACLCISMEGLARKTSRPEHPLSRAQENALFDKIVQLTEKHPGAQVVGKDHFGPREARPRQFDVRTWLSSYVPDLALAS